MQTHGNSGIYRVLYLLLILCTFSAASESEMEHFTFSHEVKVLVSDTEIVAGHVIRLKIRATGDKVIFPDIDEIDGVKVLEKEERVTNMFHYVNGVLKKERTTLILTFAPHHDMTIPSYDIDIDGKMYKSEAVKIKVMGENAKTIEDGNKFFLHLETDKKSVMVGEPILVTVKFSLKMGIRLTENPQYTKPSFKGFFSRELGDEKVYSKGNRQITEMKYLLTPLSAGTFKVGPARAKIGLADKNKRDMFGRFIGTTWHPIASNRVEIKVAKKPKESDLVGTFSIEHILDKKSVKANKPVNLTVKITGNGIFEDFEFPDYEIDGVTVYSDDAEIESKVENNALDSRYVKRFVFISDEDFSIPARHISVFDMKSQTLKYLDIPSYDVHVENKQALALTKAQARIPGAGKVHSNLEIPKRSMLDTEENRLLPQVHSAPWWLIALAFLAGILVMYLLKSLLSLQWKSKGRTVKESEALGILYAYVNASAEVEEMVRKLYAKKNGDTGIVIDQKQLKRLVEKYDKQ